MNRSRLRPQRAITYMPTTTEAAYFGEGPWYGKIIKAHADGSADISCTSPIEGSTPYANTNASPNATYDLSGEGAIISAVKDLKRFVEMKENIPQGGGRGHYQLLGL